MTDPNPMYGLVCAGGGAHGAYQVGVLKYLHEHFCNGDAGPFRVLCATSADSLGTCFYGSRSFDAPVARHVRGSGADIFGYDMRLAAVPVAELQVLTYSKISDNSASGGSCRSRSEIAASSTDTGQSIPRAGSFHSRPRSYSGA